MGTNIIKEIKKDYYKKHYSLYKNFFSKNDLKEMDKLFRIYLLQYLDYKTNDKKFIFHNQKLHNFLIQKKKRNTHVFHKLYNTIQASSPLHKFMNSEKITQFVSKIIGCQKEQLLTSSYQLRLDLPHDTRHRLNWHYDAFFDVYEPKMNLTAKSGLVFYIPLQNVNQKNGALELLEKSFKIKNASKPIKKKNIKTTTKFKTKNSIINSLKKKVMDANFGDIYIQSYCLLHQSGINSSDQIRFTLIGRYLNITDKNFKGCKFGINEL